MMSCTSGFRCARLVGRPPLPLGTMGEIRCYKLASGKVRARAYYRDYDGITREVERVGKTDTQARNKLKEACRDRGRTDAASEITASTTRLLPWRRSGSARSR